MANENPNRYILIWPDNFHVPTTVDMATEDEVKAIGLDMEELDAAGFPYIGNQEAVKINHEGGGYCYILQVNDRIAFTDNVKNFLAQ